MRFTRFKDMISYYADSTSDAPALRYEENGAICTLTYAELAVAVDGRRTELERSGGTCLGVIADGSVECALTLLAAPASGMRTVLFDAAVPEETLKALTGRFGVDRMFAEGSHGDADMFFAPISEKAQALKEHDIIEDALRDRKDERSDDSAEKAGCQGRQWKDRECRDSEEGEILFFTSGTTGSGRAVILTEQTLCASAYNGSVMLPLSPEDTLLCILPLNHVFGFVCGFLWGLSCGACVALGRGARHYIDDCAYFKPTAISAVPMLFGFLLKHSLLNPECRLVLVGAGDCPATLLRAAKALGIRVSFGYGLTETSSGVAISVDGDDPYAMAVCPDDEITIAGDGEILVKAPTCMMKGYAGEPEATAEVLQDGVLATGDLGYLDQDRKLHVTGRKKEMLVLADGTKLFLPEAEAELAALLGTTELAIVLTGERLVLILGGEPESGESASEKVSNSETMGVGRADANLTDGAASDGEILGEKMADGTKPKKEIWEKIRSFQDARPRGQQISAIRWYGKPLPRTATGKLKRWMLGNG